MRKNLRFRDLRQADSLISERSSLSNWGDIFRLIRLNRQPLKVGWRGGDHHPPHRIRSACLRDRFLAQARQPCFQALLLDLSKRRPIHTRCTRISAGEPIGVDQDVLATDLVVEQIEAEGGLRLPLCSRAFSEGSGSYQALSGSSPITFTSSKAHQKSGPFAPSAVDHSKIIRGQPPVSARFPPWSAHRCSQACHSNVWPMLSPSVPTTFNHECEIILAIHTAIPTSLETAIVLAAAASWL